MLAGCYHVHVGKSVSILFLSAGTDPWQSRKHRVSIHQKATDGKELNCLQMHPGIKEEEIKRTENNTNGTFYTEFVFYCAYQCASSIDILY